MRLPPVIENLPPAYFALVMATGIVSIAAHQQQYHAVALSLFAVNAAAYAVLWLLTLARIAMAPRKVIADLCDHQRGAGFFTLPAGTFVLGSQCLILFNAVGPAFSLWLLGVIAWAVITYAFFSIAAVVTPKPPLAEGIGGVWLVAVVATQGVAVLAAGLAPHMASPSAWIDTSLLFFLLGGVLYLLIMSLIVNRLFFEELTPQQLKPPYWVSMGVEAISTLAGALILAHADLGALSSAARPAVLALTLALWATACWWIPLLLLLGIWRYLIKRMPFDYTAAYWGMVFPLGMFTAATWKLWDVTHLDWMHAISRWFIFVAFAAWAATAAGGLVHLYRRAAQ